MPVLERMANSVSQGRSARKARTPRLWYISPTATLWSRFGMSSARAFGNSGVEIGAFRVEQDLLAWLPWSGLEIGRAGRPRRLIRGFARSR